MKFRSFIDRPLVIPHPECREEVPVYREFTDKNGATYLKLMEYENVHEKIQEASRAALTVKEFMGKYGLKQEDLPTAQVLEVIDDYSKAPTSYTDLMNILVQAQNDFSLLSAEQKAMFHNNVNEFLASAENGTIYDKLNLKQTVVEQKVNDVLAQPQAQPQSQPQTQVDTTITHNITEGVKYE